MLIIWLRLIDDTAELCEVDDRYLIQKLKLMIEGNDKLNDVPVLLLIEVMKHAPTNPHWYFINEYFD